jgi:hypothetical protein
VQEGVEAADLVDHEREYFVGFVPVDVEGT